MWMSIPKLFPRESWAKRSCESNKSKLYTKRVCMVKMASRRSRCQSLQQLWVIDRLLVVLCSSSSSFTLPVLLYDIHSIGGIHCHGRGVGSPPPWISRIFFFYKTAIKVDFFSFYAPPIPAGPPDMGVHPLKIDPTTMYDRGPGGYIISAITSGAGKTSIILTVLAETRKMDHWFSSHWSLTTHVDHAMHMAKYKCYVL